MPYSYDTSSLGQNPQVWSPHSPTPRSSPQTSALQFADNAFAGVTVLKTAHLENNRLTQLPRNLPLDKMETLTISRNPWHCNCQLAPLRKYGTATVPRLSPELCQHTAVTPGSFPLMLVVCPFSKLLSSFPPMSQVAEREPHPC